MKQFTLVDTHTAEAISGDSREQLYTRARERAKEYKLGNFTFQLRIYRGDFPECLKAIPIEIIR